MKKIYDRKFKPGIIDDDSVLEPFTCLNPFSHKPMIDGKNGEKVEDDISYQTVYTKGFRIVVYVDE